MIYPSIHDSVDRIEERLTQLARVLPDDAGSFHIPPLYGSFPPGCEVAWLQLIATWAAASPSRKLVTNIAKNSDAVAGLTALVENLPGRMAALTASSIERASGEPILDAATVIPTWDPHPLALRNGKRSAYLLLGAPGLPPPQYSPYVDLAVEDLRAKQRVLFAEHFSKVVADLFVGNRLAPLRGGSADLTGIAYELLVNAEEWGGKTEKDVPMERPLRGLVLKIRNRDDLSTTLSDAPLAKYLARERQDSQWRAMLEISIFDSGVGLAQKIRKRRILPNEPIAEELQAVRDCFAKHGTSSVSTTRGLGLFHVMRLANSVGGFLRVRTGRLHLYRDFAQDPYLVPERNRWKTTPREVLSGFQYLRDWQTLAPAGDGSPQHAYARGAVFYILLPLKDAQLSLL